MPSAAPTARHLLRARDHADLAYADPATDVGAMARRAHVSTAHFSRSFKEVFGETPHQYLQTRRIERAQELLRLTELTVGEICAAVGYTSLGSFSATFKRTVGMSPTAFRDQTMSESSARWSATRTRRSSGTRRSSASSCAATSPTATGAG